MILNGLEHRTLLKGRPGSIWDQKWALVEKSSRALVRICGLSVSELTFCIQKGCRLNESSLSHVGY
jgi:hypothetical protein